MTWGWPFATWSLSELAEVLRINGMSLRNNQPINPLGHAFLGSSEAMTAPVRKIPAAHQNTVMKPST
ncbi:hypothetical protein GZH49_40380 [Nocardia terpenica]